MSQIKQIRTDWREIIHRARNRKQTPEQVKECMDLFAEQVELLQADRDRLQRELEEARNERRIMAEVYAENLAALRERAEKAEASLDRSFQDTLAYSQQIATLIQERDAARLLIDMSLL